MSNIVKYARYEEDALAHEEEVIAEGTTGFIKLPAGESSLRILPPRLEWNTSSPFTITYQHTIEIPGVQNPIRFNCPRLMAKRPCPGCMKMNQLRATGNPADTELAKSFAPKLRVLTNAILRGQEGKGPQVWGFGKTVYEQLTSIRRNPKKGGDFTNPEEDGFDIEVEKKGSGLNTTYIVAASRNASALGNMDWIDMQENLSRFAAVPSDEELRKMLGGLSGAPVQNSGVGGGGSSGRRRSAADDMDMSGEK